MPRSACSWPPSPGDDAGALLAAVLQRVEPEIGEVGRVVVAVDAEDAAHFGAADSIRDRRRDTMPLQAPRTAADRSLRLVIHRIEIATRRGLRDPRGEHAAGQIRDFLDIPVDGVRTRDVYHVEADLSGDEAERVLARVRRSGAARGRARPARGRPLRRRGHRRLQAGRHRPGRQERPGRDRGHAGPAARATTPRSTPRGCTCSTASTAPQAERSPPSCWPTR